MFTPSLFAYTTVKRFFAIRPTMCKLNAVNGHVYWEFRLVFVPTYNLDRCGADSVSDSHYVLLLHTFCDNVCRVFFLWALVRVIVRVLPRPSHKGNVLTPKPVRFCFLCPYPVRFPILTPNRYWQSLYSSNCTA